MFKPPSKAPTVIPPPGIHTLKWLPPTLNRADLCNQEDVQEMMKCDFWGWVIKCIAPFALLFLGTFTLWGSQLLCHEIMNQPWERNCGHLSTASTCKWATWEEDPASVGKMIAALGNILTESSWETLSQDHPTQMLLNFWHTETVR